MTIEHISPALMQARRRGTQRRNKYHAKRTTVDGISFDSQKEARRWSELLLLQQAGKISGLIRQPVYRIYVKPMLNAGDADPIKCGEYRGDFQYYESGRKVVEDVKSAPTKTAVYRLKKKLVEVLYGIQIEEV